MLDLALVRVHLKADEEDIEDALLEQYLASAITICEGYCNRRFYEDAAQASADYTQAKADYTAMVAARTAELEGVTDCDLRNMIVDNYIQKFGAIKGRMNGIVVNETIRAAILFMVGHLYVNREEVVVGQYAGATQIPAGARRILEPYLWIGDLA
jgi:hypothetical protein